MIKKYLRKLSQYPRLRIILVLVVIIIVVIALFDLFSPSSHRKQTTGVGGSQITTGNLQQGEHNTQLGSEAYQKEKNKLATQATQRDVSSGNSFFKGVFGGSGTKSTSEQSGTASTTKSKSPEQVLKESGSTTHSTTSSTASESPTQFINYQNSGSGQGNPYQSGGQQGRGGMEQSMKSALDSDRSKWKLPTQQLVAGSAPKESAGAGTGSSNLGSEGGGNIMIKAGTILFAVLDNTLNSDIANSPVLATIVTGKYRGAKLIGTFGRAGYNAESLTINFSRMVLKSQNQAIGISAYAVSPKTAQAALASTVNHHYLMRFGSLFAAAFLQGFGNSYANYQNPCYGTNNCFIDGNLQRPSVTTKTAAYQGLGQIGTNVASIVQNNFYRPVTVTLKQGTAMGVLFISGVTNTPPKTPQLNTEGAGNSQSDLQKYGQALSSAYSSARNHVQQGLTQGAQSASSAAGSSTPYFGPRQQSSQPSQPQF